MNPSIALERLPMFGLTFATVLTLIVVPVLYAIFFKIKTLNHSVLNMLDRTQKTD
ncbi:hypothetical protein BGS_1409 [Beggiatoa sp. SS]|nr:hypothetical protein BGS_1409 [Beggiatoa sp. SS]